MFDWGELFFRRFLKSGGRFRLVADIHPGRARVVA